MKIFFSMILVLLTCVSMANTENPRVSNETVRDSSKTLIVYFSYSHGNTKSIAEKLQKVLGADIARLEPVTPYSHDYKKVEKQGQEEVEQQFKPKLKALGLNLKNYDRIIIGTPTWWYKMAPVVLSFMSSADFDGKKVIPFSTHAGWPGSGIKDMTELAENKGATVEKGHAFLFTGGDDGQSSAEGELSEWIESLK